MAKTRKSPHDANSYFAKLKTSMAMDIVEDYC